MSCFVNARVLLVLASGFALAGCTHQSGYWNQAAAQRYLDQRSAQWLSWPDAERAQGTVCISCHTALPYLLARETLHPVSHTVAVPQPAAELRLLASVNRRVRLGMDLPPYYPRQALASRGTEAVLNALILTHQDASSGHLSPITQRALMQLWAVQIGSGSQAGSWPWIDFRNEPWEAPDSPFVGATFAALAIGFTPPEYRVSPPVREGLQRLRDYLSANYEHEPLLNRIDLLWASGRLPQLIAPSIKYQLLSEIWRYQQVDGGWNTASLLPRWIRQDHRRQPQGSDAFATGLVALALQEAGVSPSNPRLRHALQWLQTHQHLWTGGWSAQSLNRRHGYDEFSRHFMDDAATAYAVLALTDSRSNAGHLE